MLGILHIGAEKTGTTTLQETFHRNRALLSRHGTYYPQVPGRKQHSLLAFYGMDDDRENIHTCNHPLLSGSNREAWRQTFAAQLGEEISVAAGRHRQLLVSTELFHSQLKSVHEIQRVKALLDNWCNEYRVVFYMRRQDRLAVSLYSTRLRTGGSSTALLPEHSDPMHYYDYQRILGLWGEVFGRPSLRPRILEKPRLHGQDLIVDFFDLLDLPARDLELDRPPRRNSALARDAQTFLCRMNESAERLALSAPAQRRRTARLVAGLLEADCGGQQSLPSRDAARAFYAAYRHGNHEVAREFFPGSKLFDEDFSTYPEQEQPPDSLDLGGTTDIATMTIHGLVANSLWLDPQRIGRLLTTRDATRALEAMALYLEELSPQLARHLRDLARAG